MLKIIAGEHRSRILLSPDDDRTSRPYTGRVKESVFNLLRGWFENANVLDLFAGVGTMGLEAASRGAANVVCVERDRHIYSLLKRNIESLGCADRVTPIMSDALSPASLVRAPKPVDVIFIDPPYDMMTDERTRELVLTHIVRLRDVMGDKGFVVLRSPIAVSEAEFAVEGFAGPEPHEFSHDMHVLLYSPLPRTSGENGTAGDGNRSPM